MIDPPARTPTDTTDPPSPARQQEPSGEPPEDRLDGAAAALLAWIGLAAVNAIAIAILVPLPAEGLGVRAIHHWFDAGHLVSLGILTSAAVAAWKRLGSRTPLAAYGAVTVVSAAVALLVLTRDLAGFAERAAGNERAGALLPVLTLGASLSVPAALAAGALVARARVRPIGVVVALAGAAANTAILQKDYPSIHLYLAWTSATLAAASLAGAALPGRLGRWSTSAGRPMRAGRPGARRTFVVACAVLGAAAAPTLLFRPSNTVLIELYQLDSAVVVPLLARARARASVGQAAIPLEMRPWFADRSAAPDTPPSLPRLLPANGVVVLLTIDSLRADVLAGDANRNALPSLTRLRDEGVYFEQARSPGSGTRITLATVFTGKYYSQLRWTEPLANRPKLDKDGSARFPELLSKAGVATVTYVSEAALEGAVGIARGFAEEQKFSPPEGQRFALSRAMMETAVARLRRHGEGPLFLYMHLMDAHYPYDATGTEGTPRERYLREVKLVDKEIGVLMRALNETGLAPRTALLVTADHGEAFGQHGAPYHNVTLYEELLRVPLIMRAPGVSAMRVSRPVSLVDLGPTVLDLMGLATPGHFMGQSLVPYLRGQDPALARPLIAERRYAQAMLFPDGYKVILDWQKDTEEIYDLARDPGETKNLCDNLVGQCAARLDVLSAFFHVHATWR